MEFRHDEVVTTPEKPVQIDEEEKKLNDLDTPESLTEEELRCLNMPRIINSGTIKQKEKQSNEIIEFINKNLDKSVRVQENSDLDELKKKQEVLIMIQKMVQK